MDLVNTVILLLKSDKETNRHNEVKEEGNEKTCAPKVLKKFRIVKATSLFQEIDGQGNSEEGQGQQQLRQQIMIVCRI